MMTALLARATLEAALFVALVWTFNRALPRLSPRVRAALWWCAAAKFVVALAWWSPVPVRILPAAAIQHDPVAAVKVTAPRAAENGDDRADAVSPSSGPDRISRTIPWREGLMTLWGAGVLVASAGAFMRWRRTAHALRLATRAPAAIVSVAESLAAEIRLRKVPDVRLSEDVPTPLVSGIRRAVVLLPRERFSALAESQQRMVLCHELQHVKRGDLWLGCVPALAERLFFFHPLAHLAAREYLFWRESACDASVLATLRVDPQDYGRLLLDLGIVRPPASFAAAAAPFSFVNLKRRITMLGPVPAPSLLSRIVAALVITAAGAAVVPMKLAARPARIAAAAPASLPTAQKQSNDSRFVLFVNDSQTTMSGSSDDVERAKAHRRNGESMLWFTRDGREYVVRDPALLREVQSVWRKVSAIGDEQGALGTKQGALGTAQGELGTRQGELGTRQGELGTRQGVLGARQAAMAARELSLTPSEKKAFETERREIETEMKALDEQMRALEKKMRELDKPMKELGDQMTVLGDEMAVLGKQMEEASRKAQRDMRAILERAVRTGAAQPVK